MSNLFNVRPEGASASKVLKNKHIIVLDPIELRGNKKIQFQSFKHALNKDEGFKVTIEPSVRVGNKLRTFISIKSYGEAAFGLQGTVDLPGNCDSNIVLGIQDKTVYLLSEDDMEELAAEFEAQRGFPLHTAYINGSGPTGPRYTIVTEGDELTALLQ